MTPWNFERYPINHLAAQNIMWLLIPQLAAFVSFEYGCFHNWPVIFSFVPQISVLLSPLQYAGTNPSWICSEKMLLLIKVCSTKSDVFPSTTYFKPSRLLTIPSFFFFFFFLTCPTFSVWIRIIIVNDAPMTRRTSSKDPSCKESTGMWRHSGDCL